MGTVIYVAGFLVIAAVGTYLQLRATKRKADADMQAFAMTVPAPLTDDVRQWLGPQLDRRSAYPALGMLWGITLAHIPLTPGWWELPWYWFAVLVGLAAGSTAGALIAGYRTTPLLDGLIRTVDPVRRRVSDHFDQSHVLRLRLAAVVSATAFALAAAITTSGDTATARRALLGCGLGALLVAAHYWVAATVISRPMVTSTPEGLLWQKALLAKTVEPMPTSAFQVATFSAVIAIFATVAAYRDLPLPVLLFGACFTVLAAASAAVVLVSDIRNKQRSLIRVPSTPTAP